MSDTASAVQTAIFNRLVTAFTGTGLPVFSVVPDGHTGSAVVISESSVEDIGGKTSSVELHLVTVRCFLEGRSKAPLFDAMSRVKAALDQVPLSATGFALGDARQVQANELRDIDENMLVSQHVIQVIAQKL